MPIWRGRSARGGSEWCCSRPQNKLRRRVKRREPHVTKRSTELLRVAHAHPGVTRADAARLLGVGTGAATEIVSRLPEAELLAEVPAARSGGRGRPTTMLVPHPEGPLVLAAEITQEAWRVRVVELGGNVLATAG